MTQESLLDILFAPGESAPLKRSQPLYFYRCADCLAVVTVEKKIAAFQDGWHMRFGHCGACGGWIEYMGRAERSRLVKEEEQCPCDARCTSARGPSCDCRCGGENHGSNILVTVTVDAGGIPVVNTPPAAAKLAEYYRGRVEEVQAAIKARFGSLMEMKRRGDFLNGSECARMMEGVYLGRALSSAKEMRSHGARNKKLAELLKAATAGR